MPIQTVPAHDLDAAATGSPVNRFADDVAALGPQVADTFGGKRILVVGGAGSIGRAVSLSLLKLAPLELLVVDQDENGLAELVRRVRSEPHTRAAPIRTAPLDFGHGAMERLVRNEARFDVVLNFAALKHVRSEKDVYSLLQMLDTNVLAQWRLLQWLSADRAPGRYFAVSTDKAAEPVSYMGASKRLMEAVIFELAPATSAVTSARFANVAFSAGSLLEGVLNRLARNEIVACPQGVRRYFISSDEAVDICLLGVAACAPRQLVFPTLDAGRDMPLVSDVVARVLGVLGYEPRVFENEAEAVAALAGRQGGNWWPVLLTSGATEGEKPYERFVADGEMVLDLGLSRVGAVRHQPVDGTVLQDVLGKLARVTTSAAVPVSAADLETLVGQAVPQFRHARGVGQLDEGP